MDAVLGVTVLEIEDEHTLIHEEILSPRSSLRSLQQQSEVRVQFSDWLEPIHASLSSSEESGAD